jgi:hypothetical protein
MNFLITVTKSTTFEVDAQGEEEALAKAEDMIEAGDMDDLAYENPWRVTDVNTY